MWCASRASPRGSGAAGTSRGPAWASRASSSSLAGRVGEGARLIGSRGEAGGRRRARGWRKLSMWPRRCRRFPFPARGDVDVRACARASPRTGAGRDPARNLPAQISRTVGGGSGQVCPHTGTVTTETNQTITPSSSLPSPAAAAAAPAPSPAHTLCENIANVRRPTPSPALEGDHQTTVPETSPQFNRDHVSTN